MCTNKQAIVREPQQVRGRHRVQTILDSAAELIALEGLAALSMQKITKRARTSIGSMYHFFPDRQAVIKALADRHVESMKVLVTEIEQACDGKWLLFSSEEVIQNLFSPYAKYLHEHSDYLPVMREVHLPNEKSQFVSLIVKVFKLRQHEGNEENIIKQAIFVQSMVAGALHHAFKTSPSNVKFLLAELPSVLSLYLSSKEEKVKGQNEL